jgi:hypothetical protein
VNIPRVVLRVSQAAALVGKGFADELLPHVENARRACNTADPAKTVRSSLIAYGDTDLLKRKEPTFKLLEHLFNTIGGDGHRINRDGSNCKKNSQASPKDKYYRLHLKLPVVFVSILLRLSNCGGSTAQTIVSRCGHGCPSGDAWPRFTSQHLLRTFKIFSFTTVSTVVHEMKKLCLIYVISLLFLPTVVPKTAKLSIDLVGSDQSAQHST